MKVHHIITGLDVGGAERVLARLLENMDETVQSKVMSLTSKGPVAATIEKNGIPVEAFGMSSGVSVGSSIYKLARRLRRDKPDVVQTWMYHADLVGTIASRLAGAGRLVWGLRQSNLDPTLSKRRTRYTAKSCSLLSALPERIVCCSEASRQVHRDLGYKLDRMVVIPNGFDLEQFRPSDAARSGLRGELGLDEQAVIVGMVGRDDPQKDRGTFFRAAQRLCGRRPNIHFVLCGQGINWNNEVLVEEIRSHELHTHCHLLGVRRDIASVMVGFDVLALSSAYGEGFPNVIGEAMACEVPVVSTDIGDATRICGESGWLVPIRDSEALAGALQEAVDMGRGGRKKLGALGRERIRRLYSIERMARRYETLYREVVDEQRHKH